MNELPDNPKVQTVVKIVAGTLGALALLGVGVGVVALAWRFAMWALRGVLG